MIRIAVGLALLSGALALGLNLNLSLPPYAKYPYGFCGTTPGMFGPWDYVEIRGDKLLGLNESQVHQTTLFP